MTLLFLSVHGPGVHAAVSSRPSSPILSIEHLASPSSIRSARSEPCGLPLTGTPPASRLGGSISNGWENTALDCDLKKKQSIRFTLVFSGRFGNNSFQVPGGVQGLATQTRPLTRPGLPSDQLHEAHTLPLGFTAQCRGAACSWGPRPAPARPLGVAPPSHVCSAVPACTMAWDAGKSQGGPISQRWASTLLVPVTGAVGSQSLKPPGPTPDKRPLLFRFEGSACSELPLHTSHSQRWPRTLRSVCGAPQGSGSRENTGAQSCDVLAQVPHL